MAKLSTDDLIEQFKELTLLELSELVKKFEETFEVTAAAPVAVAAAGGAAAGAGEAAEEKTSFDVVLTSGGEKKIQVIKEVRALTNLGLKEGQGPRRGRARSPSSRAWTRRRPTRRRPSSRVQAHPSTWPELAVRVPSDLAGPPRDVPGRLRACI